MPPLVSIIVPVYNEAASIEALLRKVSASSVDKEIIVVDDGSSDGTAAILERIRPQMQLQIVTQPRNCGKGRAVREALARSRGTFVLIQDGDLEYDPDDYPALLKPLVEGRSAVVYGSRFLGPHRASYFWHRVGNWVITTTVNLFFNASLTDAETGYKAFRRDVIASLRLRAASFEFEVEFTCKILARGLTIFEVPVAYYGRSYAEGKKVTWKDGLRALWVIGCCRLLPWY